MSSFLFPRKNRTIGSETLIIITVMTVALVTIASILFAQTIERYFWEIRATSVIQEVKETGSRLLQKDSIDNWQNPDAYKKISSFTVALRSEQSKILAVKVYTSSGLIVWSDLQNAKAGTQESVLVGNLVEAQKTGRVVADADTATKKELSTDNLLSIYSILKSSDGTTIGYVELYFENSDMGVFISEIHYTILGSTLVGLSIVVYLLQIAFRKQDDIIVRQARELSDIVERSPFGIFTIDINGTIVSINSTMLQLIGASDSTKLIGKNIWNIKNILDMSAGAPLKEAILGKSFNEETKAINKNNEEVVYRYQGTPLFTEDGKTVAEVLFTIEDITERKKLEENLEFHAKTLEEGVAERTKELQKKIDELEQFQRLTVDRELRMTELKEDIEKLRAKLKRFGVEEEASNA